MLDSIFGRKKKDSFDFRKAMDDGCHDHDDIKQDSSNICLKCGSIKKNGRCPKCDSIF